MDNTSRIKNQISNLKSKSREKVRNLSVAVGIDELFSDEGEQLLQGDFGRIEAEIEAISKKQDIA